MTCSIVGRTAPPTPMMRRSSTCRDITSHSGTGPVTFAAEAFVELLSGGLSLIWSYVACSALVEQDSPLLPHLTVLETLMSAAQLQLPLDWSYEHR